MIDFSGFDGREKELKKIIRFKMYERMIYRTDLVIHSNRVFWILNHIKSDVVKIFPNINFKKAQTLALVHDDAEILTGDIQLYDKLRMSDEELKKLDEDEEKAVIELSEKFPKKINGFNYKDLLMHAIYKDCIEAQVVSFCDKFDAFGEEAHEIFAGNKLFLEPYKIHDKLISIFMGKFPKVCPLFDLDNSIFSKPKKITKEVLSNAKYHTKESVMKKTGYPHYDIWKEITIKNNGINLLLEIKEQ